MFYLVNDLVILVYNRMGNFGLAFCLGIIIINLPLLWRSYPQVIQNKLNDADATPLNIVRTWRRMLYLSRIIFSLVSAIFAIGITLATEPALWVKALSSLAAMALFISLVASIRAFVVRKPV